MFTVTVMAVKMVVKVKLQEKINISEYDQKTTVSTDENRSFIFNFSFGGIMEHSIYSMRMCVYAVYLYVCVCV